MDSAAAFLDLLGEELDRRILELTDEQPRSAEDVADRCTASLPTVYRHVDDLTSTGLLTEHTQYDEEGNHYKTYAAALETATIRIEDGELTVSVSTVDDTTAQDVDDSPTPDGIEKPRTDPSAEEIERPGAEK